MDALRSVYLSLKLEDPQTYVQSGNVVFRTKEKNLATLSKKIQVAIDRAFGFSPEVILRSIDEIRQAIAATPFAAGRGLDPGKVLVTFLADKPGAGAAASLLTFKAHPEELHLIGRELYIYFPNGSGRSKLPWSAVEKLLKTPGTARNWNTVTRLLAMGEEMELGG
jgi:uncharacterized protein (DUF1697 family)